MLTRTLTARQIGRGITALLCAIALLLSGLLVYAERTKVSHARSLAEHDHEVAGSIKWAEFNVPLAALEAAMAADIKSHETESIKLNWVELLACLSAGYFGHMEQYRAADLTALIKRLQDGEAMADIAGKLKYYDYYHQVYGAVLSGLVGEYEVGTEQNSTVVWEKKYGLKAFLPIAGGYSYSHFDDFGASRSYGYQRLHSGHDMMGSVGTPIACVETGVIEELGWNQYGGWRIGVRSLDGLRYYYYAHLRKDHPYQTALKKGDIVTGGAVIGYMGRTGYSVKENVNNIRETHLHWGMQLVFDESEKDGVTQLWIDVYQITRLLAKNRVKVTRDDAAKEYHRTALYRDPAAEQAKSGGDIAPTTVTLTGEPPRSAQVPILMYHSLLKSKGGNTPYIIRPEQFEADLRYLKDNGYHTVVMADLLAFVDEGRPLPDKPVVLSFDDGHYNNVTYALPLLEKNGMRAVLSVVGSFTDEATAERGDGAGNPNYAYLSWADIARLHPEGVFEFQNHSYNSHSIRGSRYGCMKQAGENSDAYAAFLKSDLTRFQDKIAAEAGYRPAFFTYPFGAVSKESTALLKELGFRGSLSCSEGVNTLTVGDTDGLFMLKRMLRADASARQLLER